MAKRRNPGSGGDFFYVRDDVDQALVDRGYRLAGGATYGLRYEYKKGIGIFFFYYSTKFSQDEKLPEVHMLPAVDDKLDAAKTKRLITKYQKYLRKIGKKSFVKNLAIRKHHGLEIRQPAKDRLGVKSMNWDDIKDIVLNLHMVHDAAP